MRGIIVFIMIVGLFGVIEILPLHFFGNHLPWPQVADETLKRLPRIVVIGIAAGIFLGMGKTPPKQ